MVNTVNSTWTRLPLDSGYFDNHWFFTYNVDHSIGRKWIPITVSILLDNSMTRFDCNWSPNFHQVESVTIILIFSISFWIWNSCAEILTKSVNVARFNFWFCREKTLFSGSYNMRSPSRRTFVTFIAWRIIQLPFVGWCFILSRTGVWMPNVTDILVWRRTNKYKK